MLGYVILYMEGDETMFRLEFSTDNEAFQETATLYHTKLYEMDRILNLVIEKIWEHETSGTIHDANGNTIGKWSLGDK